MSRQPVMIDVGAFERGREQGAVRRTRRAADVYARGNDYGRAAEAVDQTDPELAQRYRVQSQQRADEIYSAKSAPMIARGDYRGAVDLAGTHGRPMQEILNIRTMLRTAKNEQVQAMHTEIERQARTLVGIGEMAAGEQPAAYAQWRAGLPPQAQATVPEQFSQGYVRRRLREAMTIQQIVAAQAQERNLDLTRGRMAETERHNRASEENAAARLRNSGRGRPDLVQAQMQTQVRTARNVMDSIADARRYANMDNTTGLAGQATRGVGGTNSYNLARAIDTISANIGFDRLQEMRDNSPTGGALGQVTERELALLQAVIASLDPNQSQAQFIANLARVERQYTESMAAIQSAYEQDSFSSGGGGGGGGAPDEAVQELLADPSEEARREFDEMFGAGASASVLGQ